MKRINRRPLSLWAPALAESCLICVYLFALRGREVISFQTMIAALNGMELPCFCCILAGAWALVRIPREGRVRLPAAAGAALFALCEFFGFNLTAWDSLWRVGADRAAWLLDLAALTGSFLLFYAMLRVFLTFAAEHPVKASRPSKWDRLLSPRVGFAAVLAVGLLYLGIFYPGVTTVDSRRQIAEGLGLLPLSDAHPYLHTLMMGAVIRLGRALLGTTARGIALYTGVQCLFTAFASAFLLRYLEKKRVHIGFRAAALGYFVLHPVVAGYSVMLWKDIWQNYCILLYMISLTELALRPETFLDTRGDRLLFAGSMLGILFFKNTGVAVILLTLPFLLWQARRHWKQAVILTAVCLAAFGVSHELIIPLSGIIPGQVREPLSVPMQQIARAAARDQLTEEDRQIFGQILPVEALPELYDPTIADPVKSTVNEEAFSRDPGKYIRAWAELGLREPRTYLESFLAGSCGYWYPGVVYWQLLDDNYFDGPLTDDSWEVRDPDADSYQISTGNLALRRSFLRLFEILRQVPGISTLLRLATYFWSAVLVMLVCIVRKRQRLLLPLAPLLAVFLICCLSPVYAECRYAFAALLAPPLLWPLAMQAEN